MIEIFPFIILALAVYRTTRFVIFDTLIEGTRLRFYNFLLRGNKLKLIRSKILDLFSCVWCLSIHLSYLLLSAYLRTWPWDLGINGWLTVAALSGVASYMATLEPGEEE